MIDADNWRQLLGEAMLERDPAKLRPIIDAGQVAMVERLRVVTHAEPYAAELRDLHEGLRTLRSLQIERLGYPAAPSA